MSKRNGHTDFTPVEGKSYYNAYLVGEIVEVSPLLIANNGKGFYRFGIKVLMITDTDNPATVGLTIGSIIYRQATPNRLPNGRFNRLKNAR
jgi:hypothetical protein